MQGERFLQTTKSSTPNLLLCVYIEWSDKPVSNYLSFTLHVVQENSLNVICGFIPHLINLLLTKNYKERS